MPYSSKVLFRELELGLATEHLIFLLEEVGRETCKVFPFLVIQTHRC